jgi:hypothetical protein
VTSITLSLSATYRSHASQSGHTSERREKEESFPRYATFSLAIAIRKLVLGLLRLAMKVAASKLAVMLSCDLCPSFISFMAEHCVEYLYGGSSRSSLCAQDVMGCLIPAVPPNKLQYTESVLYFMNHEQVLNTLTLCFLCRRTMRLQI